MFDDALFVAGAGAVGWGLFQLTGPAVTAVVAGLAGLGFWGFRTWRS